MEELFGNIGGSEPELDVGGHCNRVDRVTGGSGDEGSSHDWTGDDENEGDVSGDDGNGGNLSGNDGSGGGGKSADYDRLKLSHK